jgi:adenine-specific DNA-methyltransferase
MIEKLDMKTPDFTNENIAQIAALFPNCLTETKDENGNLKKAIDFDLLKQELSGNIVDGVKERYSLNWPGKKEALVTANKPINKTFRPDVEDSVNFDTTQNLYIEGDNLEALKLLQESYLNKIKMIYIDPPYNTGKDFVYKDNFTGNKDEELEKSGQISEEGRLVANLESNGRYHSDWLTMMYPRLKLARNLLKEDGVIFISIDDNEVHNLRKICDEIFGEVNFVSEFVWQKNFAPKNDNKYISVSHETILCIAKNKTKFNRNLLPREEKHNKGYSNPDNDLRGLWTSGSILATTFSEKAVFKITAPNGTEHFPPEGRCWRYSELKIMELLNDNRLWFGKEGDGVPRVKRFLLEMPSGVVPQSWLKYEEVGSGQDGTQLTKSIFDNTQIFDFPKPLMLLKRFLHIGMNKDDIILDFFSGSSTTAHATIKLNSEDSGNRKFIMIQVPEITNAKSQAYQSGYNNICEIGKERIRRVGKKIVEEIGKTDLDIGFRVLKIDTSNMNDVYYSPDAITQNSLFDITVDNIKNDRNSLDLLFQVLLDSGVDLTLQIVKENILGKEVFFVDENAVVACFEDNIDEALVTEIAKMDDILKVVFKDSSFKSDDIRINTEQIFKQYSPDTQVRVI